MTIIIEPPVPGISLTQAIADFYSSYGVESITAKGDTGRRFQVQASNITHERDQDNYMVTVDDHETLSAGTLEGLYEHMAAYYDDHDTSHAKNKYGEYVSVNFGDICEVVTIRDFSPTVLAYTDRMKTLMADRAEAAARAAAKAIADAEAAEVRQRAIDEAELKRLTEKLGR
ncbi:hypothetical protein MARCHEWKA_03760 [Brevundimonas phage vB_BpoS-Marchewka]|uniref:Uncharacterized protein n=1 Tax=Brevundimonas phage vB_BpoS-Marchewka TaxID=2948604 RepID=A0A9E7N4Z4_9CAUD|nr:hypothetical protein MARCHEWKA_03760 [Brevundimonas phage vB_BpoS-Marchewka]UTC29334.1 hypothetical protein BAMBUS_02520 [Brevundimonas phage vB_BpoS-Bambus]